MTFLLFHEKKLKLKYLEIYLLNKCSFPTEFLTLWNARPPPPKSKSETLAEETFWEVKPFRSLSSFKELHCYIVKIYFNAWHIVRTWKAKGGKSQDSGGPVGHKIVFPQWPDNLIVMIIWICTKNFNKIGTSMNEDF